MKLFLRKETFSFDPFMSEHDEKCLSCGWVGKSLVGMLYDYCPKCGGKMLHINYEVK